MSSTETVRGTLVHVELSEGQSLNDACKEILISEGFAKELPEYFTDYTEYLRDEGAGHVILNGELYRMDEEYIEDDIFSASENPDGSIDFLVQYYNGGCSLEEALEYALQGMKNNV